MAAIRTTFKPTYPFYLGGGPAVIGPTERGPTHRRIPKTITLDGYVFPIDLFEYRQGPVDNFRDAVVANDQPNDTLFSAKGAWSRYKFTWHHGCGQTLGDLDKDADLFRFESADRMMWSTKYQATLQHTSVINRSATSANPVLTRSGDCVFMSDDAALYRTYDGVTWTTMTAPGGTIQCMTTDGTDLYVGTTTGVVKYAGLGTTPTAFAAPIATNTDSISFCSGRLLCGQANVLKEIGAGGTVTTIKTHFQPAFRWTTIFNIGSRIYVGGFAGSRSELHTLTTDSSGNLIQSQEAAPLPMGHLLRGAVSFSGECALLSSAGIRFAEVSGDGTLTYGPLINEVGDVHCAVADDQFVFTGWSVMHGARSGTARFNVTEDVAPLQPSYCGDVSEGAVVGVVTGIARIAGKTIFCVASSGAWTESTVFEAQGSLNSGRYTFGTVEPKGLISLTLGFAPLEAGESIKAEVYDENDILIGAGVQSKDQSINLEVDLKGENVTAFRVIITLLGVGTSTPKLYRWRIRSYPIPPPVLQWLLPLIIKEVVKIGNGEGTDQSFDMEFMHRWLEDLYGSKRFVVLRIGDSTYAVRVDNYEWRPHSWDNAGKRPQGICIVQVVAAA